MSMTRDERILMAELARVNTQVAGFVLEFVSGSMPAERQIGFARQMADVAHRLTQHAVAASNVIKGEVIDIVEHGPGETARSGPLELAAGADAEP